MFEKRNDHKISRFISIWVIWVKLTGCLFYTKHKHEQSRLFLRSSQSSERVKYNCGMFSGGPYERYRNSIEMGMTNPVGKSEES